MQYDALQYPYPSRRHLMYARRGMVAASQPLAAQAGLDMLKRGGNAVDAAIAAAACLTVVEPTGTGIGSDAFAMVWHGGKLHGLNASGFAPQGLNVELLRQSGYQKMPQFGLLPVTVPGAPAAWASLSQRFGKLPFSQLLEPAIAYAEDGFVVSPMIGKLWQEGYALYSKHRQPVLEGWFSHFAPQGQAPCAGQIWRSPAQADTLRSLAETYCRSFYQGELAKKIDAFSRQQGGCLRAEDLAAFTPEWVQPLSVNYRGYEVWELPPNGQGLIVLLALQILKGFEFTQKETVETYHRQMEAVKLAFADGLAHITDSRYMKVRPEELLTEEYAARRRACIGQQAQLAQPERPPNGGTVYLAAADAEGTMVSYIQSNFYGFGSGVVVPETGISLQNRGFTFSMKAGQANYLLPGKRTYHTIIPGFLTQKGQPIGPFGIMGGYIQPQAHVQVLMNLLDFRLNPQAALDAPRWQWLEGNVVEVEAVFSKELATALEKRGHQIRWANAGAANYGRGQIIFRNEEGSLVGATEPRTDGGLAIW